MSKRPQKLCPYYEIAGIPGSKKVVVKEGENKKHQEYPDFRSNDCRIYWGLGITGLCLTKFELNRCRVEQVHGVSAEKQASKVAKI